MSHHFVRPNSVEELLKKTAVGRALLVKVNEELDSLHRGRLTELIIEDQINSGNRLQTGDFIRLASEVVEVFPKEEELTYFLPARKNIKKTPQGKLYDKYNNMKRYLKRLDMSLNATGKGGDNVVCAVQGCRNIETDDQLVTFHKFPRGSFIASEWMNFCGVTNPMSAMQMHVCSDHFGYDSFEMKGDKRVLKPTAAPTIYNRSNSVVAESDESNTEPQEKRLKLSSPRQLDEFLEMIPESSTMNFDIESSSSSMPLQNQQLIKHLTTSSGFSSYSNNESMDNKQTKQQMQATLPQLHQTTTTTTAGGSELIFLKRALDKERAIVKTLQTQITHYQQYVEILQGRINELDDGSGYNPDHFPPHGIKCDDAKVIGDDSNTEISIKEENDKITF